MRSHRNVGVLEALRCGVLDAPGHAYLGRAASMLTRTFLRSVAWDEAVRLLPIRIDAKVSLTKNKLLQIKCNYSRYIKAAL